MAIPCAPLFLDADWPPPRPCAYCGEREQEVVCREHSAWLDEALCGACWAACLAEVPVLPGAPYAPSRPEAPPRPLFAPVPCMESPYRPEAP
jgi:hypothetical protein